MFLSLLRITNLRSIAHLEMHFTKDHQAGRKWTMLLAENGSGKTTILRAIALVTAGSDALGALLGDISSWIRNGQDEASIEATLTTAKGEERLISLTLNRADTLGTVIERNRDTIALLDAAISHAERNYFVVGYGASRRLATISNLNTAQRFESVLSISPRADGVATLFFNDASLPPLSSWIMQLDYQGGDLTTVTSTLDHLLPGATFVRIDRKLGQVLFTTPDGEVPLERLSDGYQNVAAWCGDLLRRIKDTFPDHQDPLKTRGLLLIDEIDLHLHPVWQRKVTEFVDLYLPNFQIVCTTHSPITAQQAGPGELHMLRRSGDDQPPELIPYKGDPRLLRIDQLIASPIFGIETPLSRELEQKRQEHLDATTQSVPDPLRPASRTPSLLPMVHGSPKSGVDGILAPSIASSSLELERVELLSKLNAALDSGKPETGNEP